MDSIIPGVQQECESDPVFASYVSSLSAFSLDELKKEPERLKGEKNRLRSELINTASRNFESFISASECLSEARSHIDDATHRLDSAVADNLPSLSESCDKFSSFAQSLHAQRKLHKTALQQHPKILELLEIPQLMDTCVRNGYYDEAIRLEQYVLETLFSPQLSHLPILRRIIADTSLAMQQMIAQLLAQLKSSISLPNCIKTVSLLRQLQIMDSDSELRVRFLQCRDVWLDSQFPSSTSASVSPSETLRRITKWTDVMKVSVFEVVTQYQAVMMPIDQSSPYTSSASEFINPLSSWIARRVQIYLDQLQLSISELTDCGDLARLLDDVMYCGQSLGRIGADFRASAAVYFETRVLQILHNSFNASVSSFKNSLEKIKFNSITSPASALSASSSSSSVSPISSENSGPVPPSSVLLYPALASLLQDILLALGELRKLPLVSLIEPAQAECVGLIQRIVDVIVAIPSDRYKAIVTPSSPSSTSSLALYYVSFCQCLVQDVLPHVVSSFAHVYSKHSSPTSVARIEIHDMIQRLPYLMEAEKQRKQKLEAEEKEKEAVAMKQQHELQEKKRIEEQEEVEKTQKQAEEKSKQDAAAAEEVEKQKEEEQSVEAKQEEQQPGEPPVLDEISDSWE